MAFTPILKILKWVYNGLVKLTAKVKLQPTPEQAQLLRETLEQVNRACNHISRRAWETRTFNQFRLHKLTYSETRTKFDLTAQVVIRAIAKVADAYKVDRKHKRVFRPHGGIAYDSRILNWRMADSTVSIWCIGGRQVMPFVTGPRQLELLAHQQGETDLACINGRWFLFAVCEIEEPKPADVTDYLGVDLGIVQIATVSDGEQVAGSGIRNVRSRHLRLRSKLQRIRSHAAKRKLRRLSGREARFGAWVNHNVSRRIVDTAKGTGRGIALEQLTHIRARITARRSQRSTLHSWSFAELRGFIEYKAQRAGVPVVAVDPRDTSRTCPACGHIDKANRKSQSQFSCVACGCAGNADHFAAIEISRRAVVSLPIFPRPPKDSVGTAGKSSPL